MKPKLPYANCIQCPARGDHYVAVPPKVPQGEVTRIFVGEAPGREEVKKGEPFVGESGRLISNVLANLEVDSSTFMYTNVCACSVLDLDERQRRWAAHCCMPRLQAEIAQHPNAPRVAMGRVAQEALGVPIQDWWTYTDPPTIAIGHPAYVLREPDEAFHFYMSMAKACKDPNSYPRRDPTVQYKEVFSPDELHLPVNDYITIDIETDSLAWNAPLLWIGVGFGDPFVAYMIRGSRITQPEWLDWLYELHNYAPFVGGHNFRFDLNYLIHNYGLKPFEYWDTMLMVHAYNEYWMRDLKRLATYYFNAPDYEGEATILLPRGGEKHYSQIPDEWLAKYLSLDLYYTHKLRQILQPKTKTPDGSDVYITVYQPVAYELCHLESRGVCVDRYTAHQSRLKLTDEAANLREQIQQMTNGIVTNPASPAQVAAYLYDYKKFPPRKDKHGPRSSSKEVLAALAPEDPTLNLILQYRRVMKMISTYFDTILSMARMDKEGQWRVYPTYHQTSVVTGRLSASDPNIQNVPRTNADEEGLYGKMVRDCFIAPPDWVLVAVDGSQWEIRLAAAMSRDPFLIDAFRRGADIHGETAAQLFGPNYTKEQRRLTKGAVFEFLYGGSLQSSIHRMQLDPAIANQVMARFEKTLAGLIRWRRDQMDSARRNGVLYSRLGRRFHFQMLTSSNLDDVRKCAVNYPVQGTASDLTMLALCAVGDKLRSLGAYPVIVVHDSIVVESPQELAKEVARMVIDAFVSTATEWYPEVVWSAEAEIGERWGSMTSLDVSYDPT